MEVTPKVRELYHQSVVGQALISSLDEMIYHGDISPRLAIKVLLQFDRSMQAAFRELVKTKVTYKGGLKEYNFCSDQWTFLLRNAIIKINGTCVIEAKPAIFARLSREDTSFQVVHVVKLYFA
ncbi:hypothetical protein R1sor_000587 [Riccia sorocarpa]|uniref:Transcription initiation factor IIA subunit 2 n=1 Tax=Riccia sorocarpa TaxID=122646 RepID=A0ABD3GWP3_9MARC